MDARVKLALLSVAAAATLAGGAAAAPPADPIQRIEVRLARLSRWGGFSGSVLIAKDGRSVLARAYGLADRSRRRPNRADTRFNLASANKMFTGVAIAQLVEAGKVRFGDRVGRYVPELPGVLRGITLAQLLTHTSGLGSFFEHPDYERLKPTLTSLRAYLPLIVDAPLAGRPGGPFRYSNSGYILLGLVIERASGLDYFTYVQRNIARRAGMTATGCFRKERLPPNTALGYEGKGAPNTAVLPPRGSSAGGCYSTGPALFRFAQALLGHRLLSPELTSAVTTPKVRDGFGGSYGYGFGIRPGRSGAPPTVGHNGGFPGVGSEVAVNRGLGYVVVILSNMGPGAAAFVGDLVFGELDMP